MTYDFTSILDRAGHDALALDAIGAPESGYPAPDVGFDPIPMWVADMSFPVAPSITRALEERLQHPTFGYFQPSDAYHQAIIDWHRDRKGVVDLEPRHIGYENGVLGGVVSAVGSFAAPGDPVLVHSPTYVGFTHALEDNGFDIVHSPLVQDEGGVWRMDFEDMERRLAEKRLHVAIFCSPHNPCGRVWERWEIERAMELFRAHDCVVISDEIWSDIVRPGVTHIPTQSVSEDAHERTVALYAPSKTFNLAGLIGSYHVIYNDYLRDRVASKQRGLGVRIHREEPRRRERVPSAGHLHALPRLRGMVREERAHDRRAAAGGLACGRLLAGRPRLPRPLPHPHEPGPPALPRPGGLRAPLRARLPLAASLRPALCRRSR